jgi:hypothetical protein
MQEEDDVTEIQATLLVLGLIAATAAFIAVTCLASPRPTPAADLSVECPLTGRRVVAQLVWDDWTGQWGDVARCSALDGHPDVLCLKQCLVAENRRVLSDSTTGTQLKAAADPMTLDTSEAAQRGDPTGREVGPFRPHEPGPAGSPSATRRA